MGDMEWILGDDMELTGQIFARLTVIGRSYRKNRKAYWLCECSCGNKTSVYEYSLKKGRTKSCGCLRSEINSIRQRREQNCNWKGDNIKKETGRARAELWFPVSQPCEICGAISNIQRHHRDGDTLNNTICNIQWLCVRHHMMMDGRIQAGIVACLAAKKEKSHETKKRENLLQR